MEPEGLDRPAGAGIASAPGKHKAEKRTLLRMEFATFCAAFIQMPCQIVQGGRRLIYRLLSWNPWQEAFLRLVERLHSCWLC